RRRPREARRPGRARRRRPGEPRSPGRRARGARGGAVTPRPGAAESRHAGLNHGRSGWSTASCPGPAWHHVAMRRAMAPVIVLGFGLGFGLAGRAAAHVAPSVGDNNRYLKLTPLGDRVRLAYTVFYGD